MKTITLYRSDFKVWSGQEFGESEFDSIVALLKPNLTSDDIDEIEQIEFTVETDMPIETC